MFVWTQTRLKSVMGLPKLICCSTFTIAQRACRIRPSKPLRAPKSSCAASANCRYLSLLRVRMPTSNGVTQKLQKQPVCKMAESRLNSATNRVSKLRQKPDTTGLFPFNRRRRFATYVISHPVNPAHFIDDAAGHFFEQCIGQLGPVCGHEVAGLYGA